jgi:hypothetical protein
MIAFSATQGRRMFFLFRRLGLLPAPTEQEAQTNSVAAQSPVLGG